MISIGQRVRVVRWAYQDIEPTLLPKLPPCAQDLRGKTGTVTAILDESMIEVSSDTMKDTIMVVSDADVEVLPTHSPIEWSS